MKDFSYKAISKKEIAFLLAKFIDGMNEESIHELTGDNVERCVEIYNIGKHCLDNDIENIEKDIIANALADIIISKNSYNLSEYTGWEVQDCNYIYRVAMSCKRKY